MEDNIKQCPVCGEKYSDVICPECGFEIRQMLVAPIHPLIQKIEEQRLEIATRNWNKISNSEQQLQTLENEKKSLELRNSELEQEKKLFGEQLENLNLLEEENKKLKQELIEIHQQFQNVSGERDQLRDEKEILEKQIEELKSVEATKPDTDSLTPIAYMVCYVGGTDSKNLNDIFPIFRGVTVFGKGRMDVPQGARPCKLETGDAQIKNNHFIIETNDEPTTGRISIKAKLLDGGWDFQYIGNNPSEVELHNNDKIIISKITTLIIKTI